MSSTDLDTFRQETRDWLLANCPESMRTPMVENEQLWRRGDACENPDSAVWLERMIEKCWVAPHWPAEYGGGGLNAAEHKVLQQEMDNLGCRVPLMSFGLSMIGPVILEFGSEALKQEFLPPITRGEWRWCQGFSEPNAGSDLASLKTSAVDKGDHYIINGSKIWTTYADKADWIYCLVRTDPDAPKHNGITLVLFDMRQDGVEASPIALLTGDSHFCQTFFDNVRAEKKHVVGEINSGWTAAKRLLEHEREMMADISAEAVDYDVVEMARQYDGFSKPGMRDRIVTHQMRKRAIDLTMQRVGDEFKAGSFGNTYMMLKYAGTEEEQRKFDMLQSMMGERGLGWAGEEFSETEHDIMNMWGMTKGITIAGGSSEVQLNIIAKRALQMPE
jgi:alkylation response protein AidB-like acyl-CoA dehydrogenase